MVVRVAGLHSRGGTRGDGGTPDEESRDRLRRGVGRDRVPGAPVDTDVRTRHRVVGVDGGRRVLLGPPGGVPHARVVYGGEVHAHSPPARPHPAPPASGRCPRRLSTGERPGPLHPASTPVWPQTLGETPGSGTFGSPPRLPQVLPPAPARASAGSYPPKLVYDPNSRNLSLHPHPPLRPRVKKSRPSTRPSDGSSHPK